MPSVEAVARASDGSVMVRTRKASSAASASCRSFAAMSNCCLSVWMTSMMLRFLSAAAASTNSPRSALITLVICVGFCPERLT